jgi:hypothetical protein
LLFYCFLKLFCFYSRKLTVARLPVVSLKKLDMAILS